MENLWKRKGNCADAQYIKIFDIARSKLENYSFSQRKTESVSLNLTKELGHLVVAKERMEICNKILRFAETGSTHVSIAYAIRSELFSNANMIKECQNDIIAAGKENCTKFLLEKLEDIEADCLDKANKNWKKLANKNGFMLMNKVPLTQKLSFEANRDIPPFANCLEIQFNNEFGYHVIASRDIDVGKIVVFEESFSSCIVRDSEDRARCNTCQKAEMNFIPCEQCSTVLFCNAECKNKNLFHVHQCGMQPNYDLGENQLVAQTILMAMSIFGNVKELIEFVVPWIGKERVMPSSIHNWKSNYQMFLQLHSSFTDSYKDWHFIQAEQTFIHLMRMPAVQKFFVEESHQRFLMHLVLKHTIIVNKNGFNATNDDMMIIFSASSFFNHSCAPNVCHQMLRDGQLCITLQPIKKGEQLFIDYIDRDIDYNYTSTDYRQNHLLNTFGFECHCEKCYSRGKSNEMIESSAYYRYLMKNQNTDYLDDKTRALHKAVCEKFLNKYGRLPWCPELESITDIYRRIHESEFIRKRGECGFLLQKIDRIIK